MSHALIERPRIGHQRHRPVKAGVPAQPAPVFILAERPLGRPRRKAKECFGMWVEVGQHAVAVQKYHRLGHCAVFEDISISLVTIKGGTALLPRRSNQQP